MNVWRAGFWTGSVGQSVLIVIGILLRLRHYFENRSFWQDEICLALSITNRSFQEIWQHVLLFPDFAQAPLFFQIVEKSFVSVLGNSEMSLRLFPLLASIASVFLARRFFQRFLDPVASTVALAAFILVEPLVYFAAELKPYGVDVLAAFLVYELFIYLGRTWSLRAIFFFAAGGALVIWASNAMLFIMAGCGAVIFLEKLREREWPRVAILAGCYLAWALSLALLYHLSLGRMLNPDLLKNWRLTGGFAPAPLWTLDGLAWLARVVPDMFRSPLGMGWPYAMVVFFGAGCYSFWRKDRGLAIFLAAPMVLTLLAASFEKYPFYERMILFLVPALLAIWAAGVRDMAAKASRYGAWLTGAVIMVVLAFPVTLAFENAIHPREKEENRQAMDFLAGQYRPGDLIAISPQAQYPFWYYGQRTGLNQKIAAHAMPDEGLFAASVIQLFPNVVTEKGINMLALRNVVNVYDGEGYYRKFLLMGRKSDVVRVPEISPDALKGMGRVWIFLSHHNDPQYPSFVERVFSRAGVKLAGFEGAGVAVFLYNIPGGK